MFMTVFNEKYKCVRYQKQQYMMGTLLKVQQKVTFNHFNDHDSPLYEKVRVALTVGRVIIGSHRAVGWHAGQLSDLSPRQPCTPTRSKHGLCCVRGFATRAMLLSVELFYTIHGKKDLTMATWSMFRPPAVPVLCNMGHVAHVAIPS